MSMPTMTVPEADGTETLSEATGPWVADFERFQRGLPAGEPAVVQALRRQGIERFAALGFPTLRQEAWRLTNVNPITRGTFVRPAASPLDAADGADAAQIAPWDFE